MTIKVGINGLGRIGRSVIRALVETWRGDIEIVAANGPASLETHAHLLRYDSVHGPFRGEVNIVDGGLEFGDARGMHTLRITHERDVEKLDWAALGVDIVLECSGKFTKRPDAAKHLARGAKKVLVSAPADGADATIVYGVNNAALKAEHQVVSVGSCTTNCLAPVAKVLHDAFGIQSGFMTTIHAFTGDQNLVDGSHKDLRRARAATMSMVPTSTGAAKALGLVLPALAGKLDGTSIRVPTPNVSMIDLCFVSEKPLSKDAIHSAMEAAASGPMRGVLSVSHAPLVSIDFNHSPYSSVFDATGTKVMGEHFGRVAAWYDNEWGFSCRMLDVTTLLGKVG